jgi:endonuclease YncB( thermonuclease family)
MMAFPTIRRSRSNATLLTAILLVTFAVPSMGYASETFIGKCVGVTDGDTISVMRDGRAVKVRLEGIDCPERGQDFSSAAKKYTSALVYGKTVEVRQTGTDRYERVLAVVYADGINVNLSLVRAGLAWHFKRFSSNAKLAAAENAARGAEIGLWSLPTPIAVGLEERSERLGGTSDGQGRRRSIPRQ